MAVRPKGATHHVATAVATAEVKAEDAADAADVVAGEIAATVLARVLANAPMPMRCLLAATPMWLPDHPRCPLAMHPAMTSNGRNARHATVSAVDAAVVMQNAPKAVNARRARTATRTDPRPATRVVGIAAPNPESRVSRVSHANHARGAQNVDPTAGRAMTRVRQPCQQQPKVFRPIQRQPANLPMPLQCKTPRPNGSKVQKGVMPVRANARDANAARAMTAHAVMATRKGHR